MTLFTSYMDEQFEHVHINNLFLLNLGNCVSFPIERDSVCQGVDRVLGFLSSRLNWDLSPNVGECVPPFGSGGTHPLSGEGVGGSQFGRGDRHCGTLDIYVLCGVCNPGVF